MVLTAITPVSNSCKDETYKIHHIAELGPIALNLPYGHKTSHDIIGEFADEMLNIVAKLKSMLADSSSIRICFVIDGEPLPAKQGTHQERSRKSYAKFKQGQRLAKVFLSKPPEEQLQHDNIAKFRAKFRGYAYGWIRWFPHLKELLVAQLCERGVLRGFGSNSREEYSIVNAPFEADPVCVWIAEQVQNSIIFSPDGDLQVYPFADAAPVTSNLGICMLSV